MLNFYVNENVYKYLKGKEIEIIFYVLNKNINFKLEFIVINYFIEKEKNNFI